jgi:hypothetical protein
VKLALRLLLLQALPALLLEAEALPPPAVLRLGLEVAEALTEAL